MLLNSNPQASLELRGKFWDGLLTEYSVIFMSVLEWVSVSTTSNPFRSTESRILHISQSCCEMALVIVVTHSCLDGANLSQIWETTGFKKGEIWTLERVRVTTVPIRVRVRVRVRG